MAHPPPSLHLTFRHTPSATVLLRRELDRFARAHGMEASARFDLKVAATEALTNALRHASDVVEVDVFARRDDGALEVEVRDGGSLTVPARREPRGADGGRGIPLMLALVDEVHFASGPAGTRVRMRKTFAPG